MRAAIALAVVVACSSHAPPQATPPVGNQGDGSAPPRDDGDRRCLALYAKECGCVYPCAPGVKNADGTFTVTDPHWGATPLTGRLDELCLAGSCTPVFAIELVCDGICAPKPADPTCHFDGDACVGRSGQGSGR